MFFLLISKIIPPTSIVVPLISKYLLFTFIMNILGILNTCLVMGFYFKEIKIDLMPGWFRFIFLDLFPAVLFIKRQKTMSKLYKKKELTRILKEASKKRTDGSSTSINNNSQQQPRRSRSSSSSLKIPNIFYSPFSDNNNKKPSTSSGQQETSFVNNRRSGSNQEKKRNSTLMCSANSSLIVHDAILSQNKTNSLLHSRNVLNDFISKKLTRPSSPILRNRLYEKSKIVSSPAATSTLDARTKRFKFQEASSKKNRPVKAKSFDSEPLPPSEPFIKRRRLITFEVFKKSRKFGHLCRSIEYISSIYRHKAETNEVIDSYEIIKKRLFDHSF